jgi:ammonium transporter Rh
MEVVLNATLAGGVSIGASCDLIVTPGVAIAIGASAGIISANGFLKLGPYLKDKVNLYDTCGVHNLHGMPGIFGGLISAITASHTVKTWDDIKAAKAMFPAMGDRTFS